VTVLALGLAAVIGFVLAFFVLVLRAPVDQRNELKAFLLQEKQEQATALELKQEALHNAEAEREAALRNAEAEREAARRELQAWETERKLTRVATKAERKLGRLIRGIPFGLAPAEANQALSETHEGLDAFVVEAARILREAGRREIAEQVLLSPQEREMVDPDEIENAIEWRVNLLTNLRLDP
jgi:hypothetical protein